MDWRGNLPLKDTGDGTDGMPGLGAPEPKKDAGKGNPPLLAAEDVGKGGEKGRGG